MTPLAMAMAAAHAARQGQTIATYKPPPRWPCQLYISQPENPARCFYCDGLLPRHKKDQ